MSKSKTDELKSLWQACRPSWSEDEMDIYFEEIYAVQATVTAPSQDGLAAAAQWTEHKMAFVGQQIPVGVINALLVHPALKSEARAKALSGLLQRIHKEQYVKGMFYSLIVPADAAQRKSLESCGYMTATHYTAAEAKFPEGFVPAPKVEVREAMEWGRELWIYYVQNGGRHEFELRLNEGDFYAMLGRHDARGGSILVAYRHGKVAGFALPLMEGKPLKSGAPSTKQFRVNVRYILAADSAVFYTLLHKAKELYPKCKQVFVTGGCPAKGFKAAKPQAMVRIIDAEKFLTFVAAHLPGLQLTADVRGDEDLPVNNRGYRLRSGRCYLSDIAADSVVGPGSIPTMIMSGQPVQIPEIY